MAKNEYTLERLAWHWIQELKDPGRKEAWAVRRGEKSLDEVKEKYRTLIKNYFAELVAYGGEENVDESFQEVKDKAARLIANLEAEKKIGRRR